MTIQYAQRRDRVREKMHKLEAEAFIIASDANICYLSGFGGEGYLLLEENGETIITDSRYELEAHKKTTGLDVIIATEGHLSALGDYLENAAHPMVAFESDAVPYSQYESLAERLGEDHLEPASKTVEELRQVKDDGEIALIQRAAEMADEALTSLLLQLAPGATEKETAFELHRRILGAGADDIAFDIICACGPSAANPHARPTDRRLSSGEMVKIDTGAKTDGYCSDITRTVFLGEPTDRFLEVYRTVLKAQEAALEEVRPGMEGSEVDAVARDIITEAGFGEQFGHGLGHGVGLQVHETPRLSARSEDVLEAGMVVTVEPGIYIEDWGGVRIEDLVVVTEDGCEVLTNTPKADY